MPSVLLGFKQGKEINMLNRNELESCFVAKLNQLEQTVENLKQMVDSGFFCDGFDNDQDNFFARKWLKNLTEAKKITETIESI